MIVLEYKPKPGSHAHTRCEATGCGRSGRYVASFLGAYKVRLCAHCRIEWAKAWHDAKTGWAEEAA